MYPEWHDALHVPSIGDTFHIVSPHVVTITPVKISASFHVSVQPKSSNGVLSPHAQALAALMRRVHSNTAIFVERHLRPSPAKPDLDDLRVDLKNILENYRSALEYVAHHLADKCVPRPPPERVQFPVASSGDDVNSFSKKLDKWFPGLSTSAPAAKDFLISIQEFRGEEWLRNLADLSNFNKHRSLSTFELRNFRSLIIRFCSVGLRFGELGVRSCAIDSGGIVRLAESAEHYADIRGPQLIDIDTTDLIDADAGIEVINEEREIYGIPGATGSVPGLIWAIGRNVFRTVDLLCRHLS